jgi:2-aminoethylphosphonate transport system ATP-binding protein
MTVADHPVGATSRARPPAKKKGGRGANFGSSAAGVAFDHVRVAYKQTVALEELVLHVDPGEFFAMLGPSGSGKTTALRSVAGFVKITAGRLFIGDRDVALLPPYRRDVGMVFQQYALFPHMTVEENVRFGLTAHHWKRSDAGKRVADVLALVGMSRYGHRQPRELSGGQQQRVAIARALAIEPKVLLLDEPLSALDAQLRIGMREELAALHRRLPETTIIYVTHDQEEAMQLADRVAVLHEGKLVEAGSPRELYDRPRRRFTAGFVGVASLLSVDAVPESFATGGVRVRLGPYDVWATAHQTPPPGAGLLCLRPAHVRIDDPEAENHVSGVVREVSWRGATLHVTVAVAEQTVKVDVHAHGRCPAVGDSVQLGFSREAAVLLDPE